MGTDTTGKIGLSHIFVWGFPDINFHFYPCDPDEEKNHTLIDPYEFLPMASMRRQLREQHEE